MMNRLSRRRFIRILGSASTLSLLPFPLTPLLAQENTFHWKGRALGAEAKLIFVGLSQSQSNKLIELCTREIDRLERIFSLFLPGSSIRDLNNNGELISPPSELVEVLRFARQLSRQTDGAFDVSIQPLWHYLYYLGDKIPDETTLNQLKQRVDYRQISISQQKISFGLSRMKITLNGIAQGYITDSVVQLLKQNGVQHALIQLGETVGLGKNQEGYPWKIALKHPQALSKPMHTVDLEDMALSTSGGYGTSLHPKTSRHHLLNGRNGISPNYFQSLSVLAPSATIADGLSTALSLVPTEKHTEILSQYTHTSTIMH